MSSVLFRPLTHHASRRAQRHQRKLEIKEIKNLVKFAERYDPLRKMRVSFIETLKRSGWPHLENHTITDGVTVLASLDSKYLAFDVAPSGQYSFREPLQSNTEVHEKIELTPELKAKNDALVARGWKVVWLPQDIWMDALQAKRQHNVRFSLLLDLVLPQAPFTTRE